MFNEGSTYPAAGGQIPYPLALFGILVLGLNGVYVMPVAPWLTVCTLAGILVVAAHVLVFDRPADGSYSMRGHDAMQQLYAELEERRNSGEILPFGNWLPRHRALYDAQQALSGL